MKKTVITIEEFDDIDSDSRPELRKGVIGKLPYIDATALKAMCKCDTFTMSNELVSLFRTKVHGREYKGAYRVFSDETIDEFNRRFGYLLGDIQKG